MDPTLRSRSELLSHGIIVIYVTSNGTYATFKDSTRILTPPSFEGYQIVSVDLKETIDIGDSITVRESADKCEEPQTYKVLKKIEMSGAAFAPIDAEYRQALKRYEETWKPRLAEHEKYMQRCHERINAYQNKIQELRIAMQQREAEFNQGFRNAKPDLHSLLQKYD